MSLHAVIIAVGHTHLPAQYFIRLNTASTIGRRVRYEKVSLQKAARDAVEDLRKDGGVGGVIALDNHGNGEQYTNSAFLSYNAEAGN